MANFGHLKKKTASRFTGFYLLPIILPPFLPVLLANDDTIQGHEEYRLSEEYADAARRGLLQEGTDLWFGSSEGQVKRMAAALVTMVVRK